MWTQRVGKDFVSKIFIFYSNKAMDNIELKKKTVAIKSYHLENGVKDYQ